MLSDNDIQDVTTNAVRARKLSWLGFKKDKQGEYVIPVLSPSDFQFAREIESAATAPLLARIAELEKWQAEHWNAFEIINNYFVSKDLLLVVEDGGPDAAARNIVHSVVALERELEEARKDAERYRWLREDSIFCNLATPHPWPVWGTSHEDAFPIWKSDLDASIDAARAAIKEQT